MAMRKRGFFITLEGPDGSGKSTQFKLLAEKLKSVGLDILETREPGGDPLSEKIRELLLARVEAPPIPEAELLLFLAARAQHVKDVIQPALQRNQMVLCERFSDSTTAYQVGGRRLSSAFVSQANLFATKGLKPDLTLLFDLPVAASIRRAFNAKQRYDRMEAEGVAFLRRVRAAYLRLAQAEPRRIRIIPADQPQEKIAQVVWKTVRSRINRGQR